MRDMHRTPSSGYQFYWTSARSKIQNFLCGAQDGQWKPEESTNSPSTVQLCSTIVFAGPVHMKHERVSERQCVRGREKDLFSGIIHGVATAKAY